MILHPIILRRLERRGAVRLLFIDETVCEETISRALSLDEWTFCELERVFSMHPFAKRSAADDVVLFRSLITPVDDDRKYLGFQIVNKGSRHHITIEASENAFAELKAVFDSWCTRLENAQRESN